MNVINKIHSLFIKPPYHYGKLREPRKDGYRSGQYRVNNTTKSLEVKSLGKKWVECGEGWITLFEPNKR